MSDAAPDALRLVLFGLPGAGKSSLLAALPQIAESQPHLLNGRIANPSPNLLELHRTIDRGPAAAEPAEVVSYSFRYEPEGSAAQRRAVVIDPNGAAAEALVREPDAAAGPLAPEMRQADAVVLAVDASASQEDLDAVFTEFNRFLRQTEEGRGNRADVGGLPVFLVLTKCDRLARPGETTADWLEHIEARKREVAAHFHDFLTGRDIPNQPPGFGRLRLHLWATAVRRPLLAGAVVGSDDSYGVAELFRQCLLHAADYRAQRERSARRLFRMTLAGAGALIALLAAAASLVVADAFHREPSGLELRAESLRRAEPASSAERLRGAPDKLRADLTEWQDVSDAPQFAALPPDLRSYVEDRLDELNVYIPWLDNLEKAPRPRDALTEDDLRSLRTALSGPLAPPRPDWADTDAGRLWCAAAAESKALLAAVDALRRWYQDAYKEGDDLWLAAGRTRSGPSWNGWGANVGAWLARTEKPPDADPDRPLADGLPPTYGEVRDFPSVAAARAQWEGVRSRLGRLRDQAAVLGMIEGLPDKPALLVLPAGLKLDQAGELSRRLRAAYPDYEMAFVREPGLPPEAAAELAGRARANYQLALEPARALVRAKLGDGLTPDAKPEDADTPERWARVREWLADPKELAGWRGPAAALARLDDPAAGDPVDAMTDFLGRKSFPIELSGFTVVVPDALDVKPRPDEPLKVYFASGGAAPTARLFRPLGEGVRLEMQPSLEYRFTAVEPDQKLDFAPGDGLYAELALQDGGVLRWNRGKSRLYAFEALLNEPVLLESGQASSAGTRAEGVRLRARPENGVPKVPDLMPPVELQ